MLGNWTNKNRWAVTNTIGCFSYKYPWALWKMRNVRPWFKWSPQKWVWWGSTREQSVQIPLYGALLVPHTCRYRYICASNRHCIEDTYFFSSGATFYLFGATFFLAHRFFILARLFLLLRDLTERKNRKTCALELSPLFLVFPPFDFQNGGGLMRI